MEFILDLWDEKYIKDIAYYANNKKISDNLRNVFPYPYTHKDAEEYVLACAQNNEHEQICRAIVIDGKAVGSIGVFQKDDVYSKSAELGYLLGEEFWGKEIMTCAIKQLCITAFEKLDIIRIFAEPYAHNVGSRKALEKAGFILEGVMKNSICKNGVIFDSCMYALLK